MRTWLVVAVGILVLSTSTHADTIGVWTYTPPASYQVAKKDTQHEYTRITGQTFCLFGVYSPRNEGADLAADLKLEWTNVVAAKFTATGAKAHPAKKLKRGLTRHVTGAELADAAGTYYGELVVIRERGTVGTIFLLSNSATTITTCHPAMGELIESIAFGSGAMPTPTPAPTPTATAPAGSVVGAWGREFTLMNHQTGWINGYFLYEYVLRADGTYTYRQEHKSQYTAKTYFLNTEETGTYKLAGDKVTITPKRASATKRDADGNVTGTSKVALEKVTYTWTVVAIEGGQQLFLTPPKQTVRDGTPNGGADHPTGYLLLDTKKLYWKYL